MEWISVHLLPTNSSKLLFCWGARADTEQQKSEEKRESLAKWKVQQKQAFKNKALIRGKEKFQDTSMKDLRWNGESLSLRERGKGEAFQGAGLSDVKQILQGRVDCREGSYSNKVLSEKEREKRERGSEIKRKMFSHFPVYRLKGVYQDCHRGRQPREILGDEEIVSFKCHNPTISWPWVSK